jgi:molecular chaperone DnaK (HSP70)
MSEYTGLVIGLDLGTTNTAVSWADASELADGGAAAVRDFHVPQLVRLGVVEERPTLPSFLYLAAEGELPPGALKLPWNDAATSAVGVLARDHGAKVPSRLVSSAKSWLCYGGADRRGAILPQGEHEGRKVSPVEALASYIWHIRDAWNHTMAKDDPSRRFEDQRIVLTVPASFDPVARELTVEAAELAGLPREHLTLIEEPQAALYAWVGARGETWRKEVAVGELLLVCDVGGGTSDFSLIAVRERDGELALERVAVGDHILLGGDNLDLALAFTAEQRLTAAGTKLDKWQHRELWLACRDAKERLLSDPALDSFAVSVLGRGSRLIGSSLRVEITREDVERVTGGFMPACALHDKPRARAQAGLREVGLPFAADPAITRHLAAFLTRNKAVGEGSFARPSALLFNGGVFQAASFRERVRQVVDGWLTDAGEAPLRVLSHDHLDLAVARGAAYYGLVQAGGGIRIRGGTASAYYVGVESALPAGPGFDPPVHLLCVAPFGMEEGTESAVAQEELHLVTGEPAHFRFFSSHTRRDDAVGSVLEGWDDSDVTELAPLEVTLDAPESGAAGVVPVRIQSKVTEIGTLEVWCVGRGGAPRWRLEYNIRDQER